MRIAYLINHYPKVSHSFVRREILALERRGIDVFRVGVRGWDDPAPDPADQAERARTRYLLQGGLAGPIADMLRLALTRPGRFVKALRLAFSMWRRSGQRLFRHLAYLAEAARLVRWLEVERISHLHAHFGTNPAEVAMQARPPTCRPRLGGHGIGP